MSMHKYVRDGDWAAIVQAVAARFGVEPTEELIGAAQAADFSDPKDMRRGWSDCTWMMWFKRFLEFPALGQGEYPVFTTNFHVCFLFIYESDEELERLRSYEDATRPTPARSKISKCLYEITPIDETAGRVGPKM